MGDIRSTYGLKGISHGNTDTYGVGSLNPEWHYPEEESTWLPSSLCLTTGCKQTLHSHISLIQGMHGTYARRTCPSNPTTPGSPLFCSLLSSEHRKFLIFVTKVPPCHHMNKKSTRQALQQQTIIISAGTYFGASLGRKG